MGSPLISSHTECLSNPWSCRSAPSVTSLSTLQRRSLLEVRSGTSVASSAACATRCWTAPTTTPRRTSSTARVATEEDSDLRAMDLEEVRGASTWTPEPSLATRSLLTTNLTTQHTALNRQLDVLDGVQTTTY